jgi:hypothetical protein
MFISVLIAVMVALALVFAVVSGIADQVRRRRFVERAEAGEVGAEELDDIVHANDVTDVPRMIPPPPIP